MTPSYAQFSSILPSPAFGGAGGPCLAERQAMVAFSAREAGGGGWGCEKIHIFFAKFSPTFLGDDVYI
jgi:hypothetical protein